MIHILRWVVLSLALACPLVGSSQPSPRHDKFGKIVKFSATEIDLEVTEAGQLKVKIYVIASYAKFGPAKVGDMARVHYYTDEKGVDIAETLTVSGGNKPAAIPNPADAPDPAAVSSLHPALAPVVDQPNQETASYSSPESSVQQPATATTPPSDSSPATSASAASEDSGHSAWGSLGHKPRIAILDFDYATVQTTSTAIFGTNVDIGKGISDLLVADLVKDGSYSVVERSALQKIFAEQNFSNSDRADAKTAAMIGKLLGVDAIVVGSITEFGNKTKNPNLGGGGGNWNGVGSGGFSHSKSKINVGLTARIVSVETGEILAVAEGAGTSSRSSTSALGGGRDGEYAKFGSSDFQQTIIGEAVKQAVDRLTTQVSADTPIIPTHRVMIEGIVAAVDGMQIILNVGKKAGINPGDQFEVVRVAKEIKDPATGSVIRLLTSSVGVIKATDVEDGSAVCISVSGSDFKVGDRVKLAVK